MTGCVCDSPGVCQRHGVLKGKNLHRLCQTREDYFAAWEAGNGPGQNRGPATSMKTKRVPLMDRITDWLERKQVDDNGRRGLRISSWRTPEEARELVYGHCYGCDGFFRDACREFPGCDGRRAYEIAVMANKGRCPRNQWTPGDIQPKPRILHVTPRPNWQDIITKANAANAGLFVELEVSKSSTKEVLEQVRQIEPHVVIVHGIPKARKIADTLPGQVVVMVNHSALNHWPTFPAIMADFADRAPADRMIYATADPAATGNGVAWWPNPVHLPVWQLPPQLARPSVLICSRPDVIKAIPAQLFAVRILQQQRSLAVAIQLAPGAMADKFRRLADAIGIEYEWRQWTTREHWLQQMRRTSVLLQPSLAESFNHLSIDACSVGRPFVGSAAIRHTPDAWRADPSSPADIARVACELLDAAGVAEQARELAESVAERHQAAYRRVMSRWLAHSCGSQP